MEPNRPDSTDVPFAASTNPNPSGQPVVQPTIITPTSVDPEPATTVPGSSPEGPAAPAATPDQSGTVTPAAEAPLLAPTQFSTGFVGDPMASATSAPSAQPETPFGEPGPQPTSSSKFRGGRKRWLLLGGGVAAAGIVAGVVFGWYLPNTPDNVWDTGLNRSGSALDSFVQSAASAKQLEKYKTSTASGTATAHLDGAVYNGSFNGTFDASTMNGGASFDMRSKTGVKKTITAKLMSQVPSGKLYPDVYVQVNGLKSLGLDLFAPGVSAYDGQWLLIGSDYLQSLGGDTLAGAAGGSSQVSANDVAALIKTATSVTKDYLFTTRSDKAVFVKKAFVGKEQVDGLSTYHYTVGVNVTHVKAYCVALSNALLSTPAYQHLSGKSSSQLADAKKTASDDCASGLTDSTTASDTLDMWVDGHYKLIYKIRSYDESDRNTYTDIGQIYKGGNQVSLFVDSHDSVSPSDAKFTLNANLDTSATKVTYALKNSSSSPYDVSVTLALAASDKPVTITKPASATPIQTLLGGLGMAPGVAGSGASAAVSAVPSGSSASAADTPLPSTYTVTSSTDGVDDVDEAGIGQTVPPADS